MDKNGNIIDGSAEIHPSAEMGHFNIIGADVKICEGVRIGHHNVIAEDCVIGAGTEIMSHVELRSRTVLGRDCYVDSAVKSSGKNEMGDNVTLRYASIIARGCLIKDNCYICPQVMTNNVDHKGNTVGGAHVGKECFIGTQAVLGAGIRIARNVVVGSCSMVTKSIDMPGVYVGVPARPLHER